MLLNGKFRFRKMPKKTSSKSKTPGLSSTTTLKMAEDSSRHLHEIFQYFAKDFPGGIFRTNLGGGEIYVNERVCETTGLNSEDFLKDGWTQAVHPDDRNWVFEDWRKTVKKGSPWKTEFRFQHLNGEITWVSAQARPERNTKGEIQGYVGTLLDITFRKLTEEKLNSSLSLLNSIKNAQSKYIISSYSQQLFEDLLDGTLYLTQSEFGFIGEILKDHDGNLYLKTHTITNISWNKESRELYDQNAATGLEFHNLDTLFGAVITTGKPVISNDPSNDPRRGGIPKGHPRLKTFLGLPFYHSGKLIGMVGMANRQEGYNEELIEYLQPFLFTCSNLLQAWRNDQQRKKAESELKERTLELEHKNLALKEVLAQIENEKNKLIKAVSANVNKLLIPSLQKLSQKATGVEQKYLTLLEKNLKEITSELGPHLLETDFNLSTRELEVYNMVNGGLNTKEIATLLNVSVRTVETHRFNIRKKSRVKSKET